MDRIATENLFLLEFLVDKIELNAQCPSNDVNDLMRGNEICASVQFLDNAPLDICEEDFAPKSNYADAKNQLKNGKSCLFSLTPDQAYEVVKRFDIYLEAFRKMKPGVLPEKCVLGTSLISIENLFNELIDSLTEANDQGPAAKTLKDVFDITSAEGVVVGQVSLYIRMSCFGKLIVTQFQMNLADKSVLFKDRGGNSLYRYRKASKTSDLGQNRQAYGGRGKEFGSVDYTGTFTPVGPSGRGFGPAVGYGGSFGSGGIAGGMGPQQGIPGQSTGCLMFDGRRNPQCPTVSCLTAQQSGPYVPPYSTVSENPCNECTTPSQGMGGICGTNTMNGPGFAQGYPQGFPQGFPQGYPNSTQAGNNYQGNGMKGPGCYREIGAEMGGNALTIRLRNDEKVEQMDSPGTLTDLDCPCTAGNIGNQQKYTGGPGSGPPTTADMTSRSYAVGAGLPGNENAPFTFRMGCCNDDNKNVMVVPPVTVGPDGTQYAEISDPKKEVFVLRIGKKKEGEVQQKNNLELELCTHRSPERKPPPKLETRDTQYEEADAGPAEKGAGKGKGKENGKEKGGKKGGKKGKKK